MNDTDIKISQLEEEIKALKQELENVKKAILLLTNYLTKGGV